MIKIDYNNKIFYWDQEEGDIFYPNTTEGELYDLSTELGKIKFSIFLKLRDANKD